MKFNLIGAKEDLLSEILKKEEISPNDFLLRTKAKAVPIPISLRRIQQYIDGELYQEDGWKTAQTRHGEGIFLKTI